MTLPLTAPRGRYLAIAALSGLILLALFASRWTADVVEVAVAPRVTPMPLAPKRPSSSPAKVGDGKAPEPLPEAEPPLAPVKIEVQVVVEDGWGEGLDLVKVDLCGTKLIFSDHRQQRSVEAPAQTDCITSVARKNSGGTNRILTTAEIKDGALLTLKAPNAAVVSDEQQLHAERMGAAIREERLAVIDAELRRLSSIEEPGEEERSQMMRLTILRMGPSGAIFDDDFRDLDVRESLQIMHDEALAD